MSAFQFGKFNRQATKGQMMRISIMSILQTDLLPFISQQHINRIQ
jgi:hypothetical protein